MIFSLKRFENLLFGHHVTIYSDHRPLTFLTYSLPLTPKLTRWSLTLATFDYDLKHIPGVMNTVADFLSRV